MRPINNAELDKSKNLRLIDAIYISIRIFGLSVVDRF